MGWRCKRTNEAFPASPANQTYVPHSGNSTGCFGDVGPGILGFAAGAWQLTFDTTYSELVFTDLWPLTRAIWSH